MKVLDLFSGIGGFSLGLERTGGFETVAFCEIEEFPRSVLRKHWPHVPIYEDVRELTADTLRRDGIAVDVICGGFPCQDLSFAGWQAGIDGDRSGLWSELSRLIGELRPRYAIVENVTALLAGPTERPGAWFGRVLGDLAALGYDAEWHCIPAAALGAPHRRDRVWIVANPNGSGRDDARDWKEGHARDAQPATVALRQPRIRPARANNVADAQGVGFGARRARRASAHGEGSGNASRAALADADSIAPLGSAISRQERNPWPAEPDVGRVVDGLPRELVEPRIKALGNAVVPQIPELIGNAILSALDLKAAHDGLGSMQERK